jgi:hypothetical protein
MVLDEEEEENCGRQQQRRTVEVDVRQKGCLSADRVIALILSEPSPWRSQPGWISPGCF